MIRLKFVNRRILTIIILLFATGIFTFMIKVQGLMPHHLPAFCYCTIILIWAQTLRLRLQQGKARNYMLSACFFMLLLFFFRMCKYSYFPTLERVNEQFWYSYYICMTAIPLCMFLTALYIEPVKNIKQTAAIEKILIVSEIVISSVVMTNSLHSLVFKLTVPPDKEFTRNWFYFVILAWIVFTGLSSLYLMIRKCTLTEAKKHWYIPVIFAVAGCALLIWYLIYGGPPRIGTHKLYQMQEAFCIPFITSMESLLMTGLVSSNSGYSALFRHSTIKACIYDSDNIPVINSKDWTEEKEDNDHQRRRAEISGGAVSWTEDMTAINRLNRDLEDVTETLEDENELIRQENEVRAERVSMETRNRLYNKVSNAVRDKAVIVDRLLDTETEDEESFRKNLIHAAIISAYIKRMGNLMLLADNRQLLSSEELCLSVTESMEYLKLASVDMWLNKKGECDLHSDFVLLAYDLFECIMEETWDKMHTCEIQLEAGNEFILSIIADCPINCTLKSVSDERLSSAGATLAVKYEDETSYIRLKTVEVTE